MALKFISLALFALLIEVIFLSQELKYMFSPNNTKNNMQIEFLNSISTQISTNGVDKILTAKKVQQFSTYKKFITPKLTIYDTNDTKKITANSAKFWDKSNILELKENVSIDTKDIQFTSNELNYSITNQIATNNSKYHLVSKNSNGDGKNLYFDIKNNIIKSNKINYNINFKE